MTVFVDTSALFAQLDADDQYHAAAAKYWDSLIASDEQLATSNYVLLEATALTQGRLGFSAMRALNERLAPALAVIWIDSSIHERGLSAVLSAQRRGLSLVDCTSFEVMRESSLRAAFTFDRHFAEHGFEMEPAPAT